MPSDLLLRRGPEDPGAADTRERWGALQGLWPRVARRVLPPRVARWGRRPQLGGWRQPSRSVLGNAGRAGGRLMRRHVVAGLVASGLALGVPRPAAAQDR